jgi:hypothetical protein
MAQVLLLNRWKAKVRVAADPLAEIRGAAADREAAGYKYLKTFAAMQWLAGIGTVPMLIWLRNHLAKHAGAWTGDRYIHSAVKRGNVAALNWFLQENIVTQEHCRRMPGYYLVSALRHPAMVEWVLAHGEYSRESIREVLWCLIAVIPDNFRVFELLEAAGAITPDDIGLDTIQKIIEKCGYRVLDWMVAHGADTTRWYRAILLGDKCSDAAFAICFEWFAKQTNAAEFYEQMPLCIVRAEWGRFKSLVLLTNCQIIHEHIARWCVKMGKPLGNWLKKTLTREACLSCDAHILHEISKKHTNVQRKYIQFCGLTRSDYLSAGAIWPLNDQ